MNKEILADGNLTEHQQVIFNGITALLEEKLSSLLKSSNINEYMISLTGAAGTGKTYLTTQIVKYLLRKKKEESGIDFNFVVTAPTHKAASVLMEHFIQQNILNVTTKTIHAFLGIKPFIDYSTGEEKFKIDKGKKSKDVTSILIIDESSMIGSLLYEYILNAIESRSVNMVLFIGDPYQLLPVNDNNNEIFSLPYQFRLLEVVRQAKGSDIIRLATALREGIREKNFIDLSKQFEPYFNVSKEIKFVSNKEQFLEQYYSDKNWYNQDKILATYSNKNVDNFNRIIRTRYWKEHGKIGIPTLLAGDKLRFKTAYSVDGISLYHNNQIVTLNYVQKKYHDRLEIYYWECREIDSYAQQIFRVVDPMSYKVFNDKLKSIASQAKREKYPKKQEFWKLFFAVRDMFADVQYIYSMTIHKLQGSTYSELYLDLFSLLNNPTLSQEEKYRFVYVAITRASSSVTIFMPSQKLLNTKDVFNEIDSALLNFFT
jgi:hypothetical protein